MTTVTELALHRPRDVKITPNLQFQALILAQMNQERASLCTPDQAEVAAFYLKNAELLMEFAGK